MASNQVTPVEKASFSVGLTVAACVAFALLLAALFQVVNGQVAQADLRQAQHNAAQVAISGCAASYTGAVRRQCVEQVNAGFMSHSTFTPRNEIDVMGGAPNMPGSTGLEQVVFTPR